MSYPDKTVHTLDELTRLREGGHKPAKPVWFFCSDSDMAWMFALKAGVTGNLVIHEDYPVTGKFAGMRGLDVIYHETGAGEMERCRVRAAIVASSPKSLVLLPESVCSAEFERIAFGIVKLAQERRLHG
jgi:hypothetical protein